MMRSFFILVLIVFVSCTDQGIDKKKDKKQIVKQSILNLTHCFTPEESNVSFPIWFNDSIIHNKRISKITRSFYSIEKEGSEEVIREIRTYEFDDDGHLVKYTIKQMYELADVAELIFTYDDGVDEYGYGHVEFVDKFKNTELADQFKIYKKELYTGKYLVYSNESNGNYLFYMKNSVNWGALSVDSILHPTPDDIIVYGLPKKPEKHFQVENRVNEFNVMTVEYYRNKSAVMGLTFDKYPLEYKRTFEYTGEGRCNGFVDSTFSGNQYLTRRVSHIDFQKGDVPKVVKHVNHVDGNKSGFTELEKFEYEYYEESK